MRDPLSATTDAFTGFLFGKVETTRLPVRTSTGQAQAVYLPTAAPGLGDSGVIIGREVYSRRLIYDPFQLYGQQLPAHWLVLGEFRQRQVGAREDLRPAPTALPRPPGRGARRTGRGRRRRVEPHQRKSWE